MGAPLDLIGQRFNMLVVIERIPSSKTQKLVRWKCQCDCGNTAIYNTGTLRSGRAYSCGCHKKEIIQKAIEQPFVPKLGMYNGTNMSRIHSDKPSRNNKLHMRGVSMTNHGTYAAFIYYKGTRTYLGTYKTPEQAKAVYDEAWEERTRLATQEGIENDNLWKGRKVVDLVDRRFGKLTVLRRADREGYWVCYCDCGTICEKDQHNLLCGAVQSCGCMKKTLPYDDLTGQRFGMLTAIEYMGKRKWRCRCDCGNETIVYAGHLKEGHSKSCGCMRHKGKKTEGQ